MKIVDTHVHVWNFSKANYSWLKGNTSILNQNYDIAQLEQERLNAGVTHGVMVQAANNPEDTRWMLETAATTPWIIGVVGWLPLMNPVATIDALNKYKSDPYFKGVRHLIHDEADPKWLLQPEVIESLEILAERGIPYDLVGVLPAHIATALEVAEKIPSLKIVFDHMNQPPLKKKERFGEWGELMKIAAQHPQFHMKISGLGTTAGTNKWSAEHIIPYVEFAFEYFSPARCFCGGDWPVSLLAGDYEQTWSNYLSTLDRLLGPMESGEVLYDNAVRFYDLNPQS